MYVVILKFWIVDKGAIFEYFLWKKKEYFQNSTHKNLKTADFNL